MNYIITADTDKIIARQLKSIEKLIREKKNILELTKATSIPAYWDKNIAKIGDLSRDTTEIKLSMRRQIKGVDSYTFNVDEMDILLNVLDSGVSMARYFDIEVRTLQKTVSNVLEVIRHEVASHQLEHIITYQVGKIDSILDLVATIVKGYDTVMKELNELERKA